MYLHSGFETVEGVEFFLKISLHAFKGTPWMELVFKTVLPEYDIKMKCVQHSLQLAKQNFPIRNYLDIYVKNSTTTTLQYIKLRNGVLGEPDSMFA